MLSDASIELLVVHHGCLLPLSLYQRTQVHDIFGRGARYRERLLTDAAPGCSGHVET